MAMEYHDTTVEEYPDMQIPGRLFELRDLIDDSDMSEVYMFGTTSYRGNYGNPSFCLGPADVDIKQIDVGGLIEENLQAFCDCGTADDVRQILGLVQEDELSEDQLEYEEFSYVDKGWCIDGLVESFERIELPEEKEQSISFDRDLIEKGLQQGVINVYHEDEVDSRVVIGDYWFWAKRPYAENEFVDCVASALENLASDPEDYADELAYYAAYLQENVDRSELTSLAERCNGAKDASQGLDNHDTKDTQHHDVDARYHDMDAR